MKTWFVGLGAALAAFLLTLCGGLHYETQENVPRQEPSEFSQRCPGSSEEQ